MPIAFMGISSLYPERAVNDPRSEVAIANGQYLLIRRAVYEVIGGYANPELRGTVVDDRDLARQVKRRGYRLVVADGRALVRTQSITVSASTGGAGARTPMPVIRRAAALCVPHRRAADRGHRAVCAASGGARRPAEGVGAGGRHPGGDDGRLSHGTQSPVGHPRRYVWTHPLGAAVFTGILGRAAWGKLTGRTVAWRGRSYRV